MSDGELLHPAFAKCQELMNLKAHDYGGGGGQDNARREYHPLGEESYYQMLHTKLKRIEKMIKLKRAGKAPHFENLKDSIEDLINYAAFMWSYVDEEEHKQDVRKAT